MYSYKIKKRIIFLRPKNKAAFLVNIAPGFVGFLIVFISRINPYFTERVYSNGIFLMMRRITSVFGNLTPFSLAGIILFFCAFTGVLSLLYMLVTVILSSRRKEVAIKYVKLTTLTLSFIYFLFALTCAPNYNRLTFAELAGLTIQEAEIKVLADLCGDLIDSANALGASVLQQPDFSQMAKASQQAFNSLDEYQFISRAITPPKPMVFSQVLSYLQLTGFYFPYTGEATVNENMPDIETPFTMCHELAHTAGFMREDEANFIAYAAGRTAHDPFVRYSVTVCALNHCMNAVYQYDQQLYASLRSRYSEKLSQDIIEQSRYWAYYDTPVAQVSDKVNSVYLKANSQTDGTHSYGRMVDLMIADYLGRNARAGNFV